MLLVEILGREDGNNAVVTLFVDLVVALYCLGMYEVCGEMWLCGG